MNSTSNTLTCMPTCTFRVVRTGFIGCSGNMVVDMVLEGDRRPDPMEIRTMPIGAS